MKSKKELATYLVLDVIASTSLFMAQSAPSEYKAVVVLFKGYPCASRTPREYLGCDIDLRGSSGLIHAHTNHSMGSPVGGIRTGFYSGALFGRDSSVRQPQEAPFVFWHLTALTRSPACLKGVRIKPKSCLDARLIPWFQFQTPFLVKYNP